MSAPWIRRTGAAVAAALLPVIGSTLAQQPSPAAGEMPSMAEMMKKAECYTKPGESHKLLARLIGTWETETRFTMPGMEAPPEKGTAETSWLMEGRWVKSEAMGTLMGMPSRSFTIIGYDNMKMSYVVTTVTSLDTAMNRSEGDLDPSGDVLITYGTIDEYLTGEHDKMVKVVWRFLSDDRMVMEVHDLPIGEHNTKVLEIAYTRRTARG